MLVVGKVRYTGSCVRESREERFQAQKSLIEMDLLRKGVGKTGCYH